MKENQTGQALLIILLIMMVGLTVTLSLLFRTTTDIKLSSEIEESTQAFEAAEAGIEEGLRGLVAAGTEEITSGLSFNFIAQEAGQGSGPFSLGKLLGENVGTVWLANHDADGNLDANTQVYAAGEIRLCWKGADSTDPKIEAITLYKESGVYKVARGFYEPSGVSGAGEDCGADNSVYPNKTNVNLPTSAILLALRLKPVGGDAFIAVDPPGDNALPSQGKEVISTGKAGETVRRIRVVKSYPAWPEIFDHVLFSGGRLVKE